MKEFYNPTFQTSLPEIKNEKRIAFGGLKAVMQITFVLSLLLLVLLAFAKAGA